MCAGWFGVGFGRWRVDGARGMECRPRVCVCVCMYMFVCVCVYVCVPPPGPPRTHLQAGGQVVEGGAHVGMVLALDGLGQLQGGGAGGGEERAGEGGLHP